MLTISVQYGDGTNGYGYQSPRARTLTGTREELLAVADTIESQASRRGYSGVLDRNFARDIRNAVNAA